MTLSIVIPVLDDGERLGRLLKDLRRYWPIWAESGTSVGGTDGTDSTNDAVTSFVPEVIGVDAGSRDDGVSLAKMAGARVLVRGKSRGLQLDEGARVASGPWVWFLHADSGISADVLDEMARLPGYAPCWGRFDVRLANTPLLGLIALAMNWRSAVTGICTGDQGIFVHRSLLEAIGGVPRQPLMEDIELCRKLRRIGKPLRLRTPLGTSARRWREQGVLKTMTLMWSLRLRYFCGASAEELCRRYYG